MPGEFPPIILATSEVRTGGEADQSEPELQSEFEASPGT